VQDLVRKVVTRLDHSRAATKRRKHYEEQRQRKATGSANAARKAALEGDLDEA
jgi:hypothetical protein